MSRPYSHPTWRRVRPEVLERDGWRCQIQGPRCQGDADVVDHIVDWRDGGAWFDPSNLRAACGRCNTWRSNRKKREHGWRRSATHIVLVVGPPGAGKSTYVRERAGPTDLVIDYDVISDAFGPSVPTGSGGGRHKATVAARGAVLTELRRGEIDTPRAWIISANPKAEAMFPHHEVAVIDPGRDEVLRRCGSGRSPGFATVVDRWYRARSGAAAASREW